ncbi:MAG: winged helix-turn-helix domain-containing protein [Patescibacteria group bacterium]|nr:winged helix-turn-helix domain-containing protein [Patescibacteria group bacterium]
MLTKIRHILTEETEKFLFKETILSRLLAGESLTAIWIKHGGRSRAMTFLSQYSEYFDFKTLGKYQILFIDQEELTEETSQAYFRLMFKNLCTEKNLDQGDIFFSLKEKVKEITDRGEHLIFILGRFDELNFSSTFFNNLKNLWQVNKTKIHYIFPIMDNIFLSENFEKYDQLREVLSQNLVYFPLFSKEDTEFAMDYFSEKYGYPLSPKKKKLASGLSGGHPSLLKACLRILNETAQFSEEEISESLSKQWEIKIILEDIWKSFDEQEKKLVSQIVFGQTPMRIELPERFVRLRVIKEENSQPVLFSPLLTAFVKKQSTATSSIGFDPETGELLINGFPPQEKITLQEYRLLRYFLANINKIVSRDQIAYVLWDKESDEKYSDWAIDQVMSQLRKKIDQMGIGQKLQTIRGRGYRWLK